MLEELVGEKGILLPWLQRQNYYKVSKKLEIQTQKT